MKITQTIHCTINGEETETEISIWNDGNTIILGLMGTDQSYSEAYMDRKNAESLSKFIKIVSKSETESKTEMVEIKKSDLELINKLATEGYLSESSTTKDNNLARINILTQKGLKK